MSKKITCGTFFKKKKIHLKGKLYQMGDPGYKTIKWGVCGLMKFENHCCVLTPSFAFFKQMFLTECYKNNGEIWVRQYLSVYMVLEVHSMSTPPGYVQTGVTGRRYTCFVPMMAG